MSQILKLIALPISIILICLGIMTILGGHITPGGGFQGGAMIASGVILSVLVYGIGNSPIEFSHTYIELFESIGALGFIVLGLVGLLQEDSSSIMLELTYSMLFLHQFRPYSIIRMLLMQVLFLT